MMTLASSPGARSRNRPRHVLANVMRVSFAFALISALVAGVIAQTTTARAQLELVEDQPLAVVETLATGVSAIPADPAGWRVVEQPAAVLDEALPANRPLGFVIADQTEIIVNDYSFGTQALLSPNQAVFVAQGVQQARTGGDVTGNYLSISVVPGAETGGTPEGTLRYGGSGFAAPTGGRAIDLLAVTLDPDASTTIDANNAPALVFVTEGAVQVNGADLGVREASEFSGTVELANTGADPARALVAVIGDEVPPAPSFVGSVTLVVQACPEGTTRDNFVPAECADVAADQGFEVGLLDGADQLVPTADTLADSQVTWSGLTFGTYTFTTPVLPAPFDSTLFTDVNATPVQFAHATISVDAPDVTIILFVFPAPEPDTGSILVDVRICPEGMRPEGLAGDFCEPAPADSGFGVAIVQPDGSTLTLADATVDGILYIFSDLPLRPADAVEGDPNGIYTVDLTALPAGGYEDYVLIGATVGNVNAALNVTLTANSPNAPVTIYAFLPAGEPTPTPEPEQGIVLQVAACPEGTTPDEASDLVCPITVEGFSAELITPDGGVLTLGDADSVPGGFRWDGLADGTYAIGLTELPAGFVFALAPGYPASPGNPGKVDVVVGDGTDSFVLVFVFDEVPE